MSLVESCICTIILIWFFKAFKHFDITIADFYHYLDIINWFLIELECTEAVNMILKYRQNVKKYSVMLLEESYFYSSIWQ